LLAERGRFQDGRFVAESEHPVGDLECAGNFHPQLDPTGDVADVLRRVPLPPPNEPRDALVEEDADEREVGVQQDLLPILAAWKLRTAVKASSSTP
jgi:hypothetical protein